MSVRVVSVSIQRMVARSLMQSLSSLFRGRKSDRDVSDPSAKQAFPPREEKSRSPPSPETQRCLHFDTKTSHGLRKPPTRYNGCPHHTRVSSLCSPASFVRSLGHEARPGRSLYVRWILGRRTVGGRAMPRLSSPCGDRACLPRLVCQVADCAQHPADIRAATWLVLTCHSCAVQEAPSFVRPTISCSSAGGSGEAGGGGTGTTLSPTPAPAEPGLRGPPADVDAPFAG